MKPKPVPENNNNSDSKEKSSENGVQEIVSFFKTLVILVVIAIVLRASVVEAFRIPSRSMVPTLQVGDHILVSKFSYGVRLPFVQKSLFRFSSPQRGDIVVFTLPDDPKTRENESRINIIKRVIGLPGDKVEIKKIGKGGSAVKVYVNNVELKETYAVYSYAGENTEEIEFPTVPPGSVLLLGDNRDSSRDSRAWDNHFLDMDRIKGRALIIYWSWDEFSRIGNIIK